MVWLKVFHLFGVIAWFAGLFYLPRLFVYHADAEDQVSRERFVLMEQRLLKVIMLPAALLAIGFGAAIVVFYTTPTAYLTQGWFLAKLTLVGALVAFHLWCSFMASKFANGVNPHGSKTFRVMNEVPTLILLLVLVCAVARPF